MEIFIFRIVERVIVVLIGSLSIYLGYRLFHAVKAPGESVAEVKLPGDVTVMLCRIGPGVFFALFGTAVVTASLQHSVRLSGIDPPEKRQAFGQVSKQHVADLETPSRCCSTSGTGTTASSARCS